MRKKRLLIDVSSIISYIRDGHLTGIGRTTYELLNQWNKIEDEIPFDMVLYSQNTKGVSPKGIFKFNNLHLFWPDRTKWKKFLYPLRIRKLISRYDLMHVPHNVDVMEDVNNTILTIHDVMAYRFSEEWGAAAWRITDEDKRYLKRTAQQCRAIVTCSECSKNDIVDFLEVSPEKVVSIPWGVNREMFYPIYDKEYLCQVGVKGLYYFTSSANHPRKNLPLLLQSYRRYLELGGVGQLVVLNPEVEHLTIVKDLIENGNIVILRKISDHELAVLYTGAQCSLMLTSYEGFGLPILESLACGTQVISARNSSLIEAGGNIVDFLDNMEVATIAEKMLSYDNREKTSILDAKELEEHLQDFSWEACARRYIKLYSKLLEIDN